MHVLDVAAAPFWEIPYYTAGPGGTRQAAVLPLLRATVDALPAGIGAVLACSNLQGRVSSVGAAPGSLLGEGLAAELLLLSAAGEIPEAHHLGIFLLGDLYADAEARIRGAHGDVGAVWRRFAADFRWVVGVAGNHDVTGRPPVPGHARAHLLDGEVVIVDSLRVGGLSGIIGAAKEGRAWRRDERSFTAATRAVLRANPHVLLLHQGPGGDRVEQPGHAGLRTTLERAAPVLTLCGHVHWREPLAALPNGGQVLNVDGRAVVLQVS